MSQSYASIYLHVVFGTKSRAPTIADEIREELHAYIGGIVNRLGCHSQAVGGTRDHVHILAQLSPATSTSDLVNKVKSNTSVWMKTNRENFAWQAGYGAFSFETKDLPRLLNYVTTQEEHHRKVTFEEEFLELLKEHGESLDEYFSWDK